MYFQDLSKLVCSLFLLVMTCVAGIAQAPSHPIGLPKTAASAPRVAARIAPKPYVDVRDYVTGDGRTDDTTGLQTAIDSTPDSSEIVCPNVRIKIGATIRIYGRRNLRFRGTGVAGPDANTGCSINWAGPDGGTMVDLQRSRDLMFAGITFALHNPGSNEMSAAGIGVNIGQSVSGPGISTHVIFDNVNFVNQSTRNDTELVHIGDQTGQNGEFMKFLHCHFSCGSNYDPRTRDGKGTGAYISHTNVKSILFEDSSIGGCNPWIRNVSGSFIAKRTTGGSSRTVYSFHGSSEPILIESDNFEAVYQVLSSDPDFGPHMIHISGGRYSDPPFGAGSRTSPYFDFQNASTVLLEDMQIDRNSMEEIIGATSSTTLTLLGGIDFKSSVNAMDPGMLAAKELIDLTGAGVAVGARPLAGNSAGYNLVQSTGSTVRGFWMNNNPNGAQFPVYGLPPCAMDALCIADGELEISGLRSPRSLSATVVGSGGNKQYIISVIARDTLGRRTLKSVDAAGLNHVPSTLDEHNYIHLSNYAVSGAASYVFIQTNGGRYRVIGTTASITYDIKTNPTGTYDYRLPTFNETTALRTRAPLQLPLLKAPDTDPPVGFVDLYSNLAGELCTRDHTGNEKCSGDVPPKPNPSSHTPNSSTESCSPGTFWTDANFIYACVEPKTIKRAPLTSW